MKTMKQQASGRCVFCDGAGLSKQHVWPYWMKKIIQDNSSTHQRLHLALSGSPIPDVNGNTNMYLKTDLQTRNGPLGSRQLRIVCRRCNNEWMSAVEQATESLITRLFTDSVETLAIDDQLNLVAWIALMTIIGEYTDLSHKKIPQEERVFYYHHKHPPHTWRIWIGKADSKAEIQSYVHSGTTFYIANGKQKRIVRESAQISTFRIGKCFICVLSADSAAINEIFSTEKPLNMIEIWPSQNPAIDWMNMELLDDKSINHINSYMDRFSLAYADIGNK